MKTRSVARKENQEEIRRRGGYEREKFHGGPKIDRNDLKEKFQNKLAYGVEDPVQIYREQKAKNKTEKPKPTDRWEIFE